MLLTKLFKNDPRVYYEAKALREAGHDVTVLVWARHDDKRELPSSEEYEGIKVHYIHIDGGDNPVLGNIRWWKTARKKALELYYNETKFQVVHCHDLDTLPIGVKLKKKLGVKLVYDAHEIFHRMIQNDNPGFVVFGAKLLEKKLITKIDYLISTCEPFREYLSKMTNSPSILVRNCKPLIIDEYSSPSNSVPVFLYIGVLHQSRMFPEIVDLFGSIDGLIFRIAGKKENLYDEVKRRASKYDNVEFLGTLPYDKVLVETLKADVILWTIDSNDQNLTDALANKQFEAMACGKPIIVSEGTYAGEMTKKNGVGLVVSDDFGSIQKAVERLRDDKELREKLGRRAFEAAVDEYNWEKEKKKLIGVYEYLSSQ